MMCRHYYDCFLLVISQHGHGLYLNFLQRAKMCVITGMQFTSISLVVAAAAAAAAAAVVVVVVVGGGGGGGGGGSKSVGVLRPVNHYG